MNPLFLAAVPDVSRPFFLPAEMMAELMFPLISSPVSARPPFGFNNFLG